MRVDLNADLGEGFGAWPMGDDDALLAVVTSANVACGFHAGDPAIMTRVCRAATQGRVRIGAQVSYRDLAGFGRRVLPVEPAELTADVVYQIGALAGVAASVGATVGYVKPHGALYNQAAVDVPSAQAVIAAVLHTATLFGGTPLPLLCQPGSVIAETAAEAGIRVVAEAFADRAYRTDGTLVPRDEPGAVLHDATEIAGRVLALLQDGGLNAQDGGWVELSPESICVHGDTPGAVDIARAVRAQLSAAGIEIAPFLP